MNPVAVERFLSSIMTAFAEGDPYADEKEPEQANVQLLKNQYTAIARGDIATFAATLSDDVELEIIAPPQLPIQGKWKGKENVLAAVGRNFDMLADQHPEILSVVAQGDTIIVFAKEHGLIKATNKRYHLHWMQRFTFRDGLMVSMTELGDTANMIEAAQDA